MFGAPGAIFLAFAIRVPDRIYVGEGGRMQLLRPVARALLAGAATAGAPQLEAQDPITVERIFETDDFRTRAVSVEWVPGGDDFLTIEAAEGGSGSDLWVEGI